MLDERNSTWEWDRSPSSECGTTKNGFPRYKCVKQHLSNRSFRQFKVGDVVTMTKREDVWDHPEIGLHPHHVFLAQIVDMFEDVSKFGEKYPPFPHMISKFRWLYGPKDVETNSFAVEKREKGPGSEQLEEISECDFFWTDLIDVEVLNSVSSILGKAFMCQDVELASRQKHRLEEGMRESSRSLRNFLGSGDESNKRLLLPITENDRVYLCRWFYKTGEKFGDKVNWLPEGKLMDLLAVPTFDSTFDSIYNVLSSRIRRIPTEAGSPRKPRRTNATLMEC